MSRWVLPTIVGLVIFVVTMLLVHFNPAVLVGLLLIVGAWAVGSMFLDELGDYLRRR